MRIVHFSTYDISGGAARAAHRLHRSLRDQGVDSRMIVQRRLGNDETVSASGIGIVEKVVARLSPRLDHLPLSLYRHRDATTYSVGWHNRFIPSGKDFRSADLYHLHWIGDGFISLSALPRFNKPLVWTLHDAWAFTGGCHFFGSCSRYQKSCGRCPQLGSSTAWDLSRWIWYRKKRNWRSLNLTVVAPSKWLAQCASDSSLFGGNRIEVIPLGLDLGVFRPLDRSFAREALNLPLDKRIIAMGAVGSTTDPRKGFHQIVQATRVLASRGWAGNCELLVFGDSQRPIHLDTGLPTSFLGVLQDQVSLALVYSAADVFVAPSLQENFCQTVLEALACGTPAVAFHVGGMPDLIEHGRTGYLARAFDVEDLAKGIAWVIDNGTRLKELSIRSRQWVEANFSNKSAARRYRALYEELLRSTANAGDSV